MKEQEGHRPMTEDELLDIFCDQHQIPYGVSPSAYRECMRKTISFAWFCLGQRFKEFRDVVISELRNIIRRGK